MCQFANNFKSNSSAHSKVILYCEERDFSRCLLRKMPWPVPRANKSEQVPHALFLALFCDWHWSHFQVLDETSYGQSYRPYAQVSAIFSTNSQAKSGKAQLLWWSEKQDLFHISRMISPTSLVQKEPWWGQLCLLNNNSCINMRSSQLKGNQHQNAVKHRTRNLSFFEETRLKRGVSSYGWVEWEFSCNKRTSRPRKN